MEYARLKFHMEGFLCCTPPHPAVGQPLFLTDPSCHGLSDRPALYAAQLDRSQGGLLPMLFYAAPNPIVVFGTTMAAQPAQVCSVTNTVFTQLITH
jgi:hypothetical protein